MLINLSKILRIAPERDVHRKFKRESRRMGIARGDSEKPSAIARLEAPKREVHARLDRARRLGNSVSIVTLRLVAHDQEVALT